MIYYTADLHLGHENIIRAMGRPYNSAKEMDADLINKWNLKVGKDDEVYIIGDLSDKDENVLEQYVTKLQGRKHLIIGNHDEYWLKSDVNYLNDYFESINYMDVIMDGDKSVTLCHYPMFEWNRSRYITSQEQSKFWLIHGHIHNTRECDAYKLIREKLFCALNAGVDINCFEPVTFEELLSNNNKWYKRM